MIKKALLIAGISYFTNKSKVYNSPEPLISMVLRGQYENKIRRFSPPQKIFDVFATIYEKGRLYMTLKDLLKAICFYNYSLSDEKDVQGFKPEKIVKFLGKQTKFEIYDYFILVRFLAYSRNKIISYFEQREINEMNIQQFKTFMKDSVCRDYQDYIKQGILVESRQFRPDAKSYEQKIEKVCHQLFDAYKREKCTLKQIVEFRRNIINELYHFQFLMFPIQQGCIDGVDFARSIVKYIDASKTRRYMKRIQSMQELQQIKITKDAYIGFHTYMQTNIGELQKTLNKKGAISAEQFTVLINKFVKANYMISKEQVGIVVKLLDNDNSGFLEKREIFGVLKNLQYYTSIKSGDNSFMESIKEDLVIIRDKLIRIKQIIEE